MTTRRSRRERVEQMAALNDSYLYSFLEWGAETNYSLQAVTATVVKYPLEIMVGVYKNLLAAREDFREKHRRRQVQQDDSESVTTTTRIEFLEQELLRLRAAMEKEVAQRRESPIKTVPLDQEDAAAAAAVAAVAAAMANAAAAAAANEAAATAATPSTPSTPKSRPAQVPAPPPMPSALEVSDRPSPASFAFDGGLDYEHEEKAAQRRGSLICLQHIRSGVQLKKARKRRPSKKALAKSAKPEHKTIADLIRENNQKIGPAIRMYDDSPDQHEDDGWEEDSQDSPATATNTSRRLSPVSYSSQWLAETSQDMSAAMSPASFKLPAPKTPLPTKIDEEDAPQPVAAPVDAAAPPAPPAPPVAGPGGIPPAPSALPLPPPPAPKLKGSARPSFVMSGNDFLMGKSKLKKAKKGKKGKKGTKDKNAPKKAFSLADAVLMQHKKLKSKKKKKRKSKKAKGKQTPSKPSILGAIQNARSALKKTPSRKSDAVTKENAVE